MTKNLLLSEAEKQSLVKLDLNLKFVDDMSEFKCARCSRVAFLPHLSNCQHVYCRNCKAILTYNIPTKCILCQRFITNLNENNFLIEKKLYDSRTHCPNLKYGCTYVTNLKHIPEHLSTCKDTRESILPVELVDFKEADVESKTIHQIISQMQQDLCKSLERERQLTEKINQLQLKYEQIQLQQTRLMPSSDDEIVNRINDKWEEVKEMIQSLSHETSKKSAGDEMNLKMEQLMTNAPAQRNPRPSLVVSNSWWQIQDSTWSEFEWKVVNFQSKLSDTLGGTLRKSSILFQTSSDQFLLQGYDYGARLEMVFNNESINVWLVFKDIHRRGDQVLERHPSRFTCVIVNHHDPTKSFIRNVQVPCTDNIKSFDKLHSQIVFNFPKAALCLDHQHYVQDGCLTVKFIAENPALIHYSPVLQDQSFAWHIDNYRMRKQRAMESVEDEVVSPCFYAKAIGSCFGLSLSLGGSDMMLGTGLSAKIKFFAGLWDAYLIKPQNYHLFIVIIDQSAVKKRGDIIERYECSENKVADLPIAKYERFENEDHLKDDRLVLKIILKKNEGKNEVKKEHKKVERSISFKLRK